MRHLEKCPHHRAILLLAVATVFCLHGTLSHARELVVLQDGRFFAASFVEFDEGQVTVELESGGTISFSAERVVDVVQDEEILLERDGPPFDPGPAVVVATVEPDPRETYQKIIREVAAEHGVEAGLVEALVQVESNFNPTAVSKAGAVGLMQLMPSTARAMAIEDPFDPRQNILGGVRYLANLLKTFEGKLEFALAAYNAGPDKVRKYGGIPPFPETRKFVKKVLELATPAGRV